MESDGPEKYKSQALCLHQTPRPRPGLGCKHHPPTTKDFSEIDICFFQFHIGTQIKTKKGNRVGGDREIEHPRFAPAQDARGRPSFGS